MYPQCWRVLTAMGCLASLIGVAHTALAQDPPPTLDPITVVGPSCPQGSVPIFQGDSFAGCGQLNSGSGNSGSPGPGNSRGGGGSLNNPNNSTSTTDSNKDKNPDCNRAGDPIQVSQQSKIEKLTLFSAPGEMGLAFHLFYISPLGWNDSLSYWLDLNCGQRVMPPPGGGGAFDIIEPDGLTSTCQRITFHRPDGLGATTAGLGGLSTGSGVVAGALKTYASGWDFRYIGSAVTSAVLARFGGAFARALPKGSLAAELASGAIESSALSYSMPEPPCADP